MERQLDEVELSDAPEARFSKKKASQENDRATDQLLAGLEPASPPSPIPSDSESAPSHSPVLLGPPSPPNSTFHSTPKRCSPPLTQHSSFSPSPNPSSTPQTSSPPICRSRPSRKRSHASTPGDSSPKRQCLSTTRQSDITNVSIIVYHCVWMQIHVRIYM